MNNPEEEVAEGVARQGTDVLPKLYDRMRDKENYNERPWSIYFYYIDGDQGSYRVRHYFKLYNAAIQRNDLPDLIEDLVANARLPLAAQDPQPNGSNFKNIVWRYKSYIVVLVDDPAFELVEDAAVDLRYKETNHNHSFFDAKDFKIDLPRPDGGPGTQRVTAFCCINHMKRNLDGDDLKINEKQYYYFAVNDPQSNIRFGRRPDDDGGLNLGPPTPPPA